MTLNGSTVTAQVTVRNTGNMAGKDVVELYYTPPYTNGGLEKAAVNLIQFGKTDMIQPDQSQQLTLEFDVEDMASFDAHGVGGYILEAGDYEISLRSDSHTVVGSKTITLNEVVYTGSNAHNGDVITATNRFDFAEGNITYLSRANAFANYAEATAAPSNFNRPTTVYANGSWNSEDHNNPNDAVPTTGKSGTIKLAAASPAG